MFLEHGEEKRQRLSAKLLAVFEASVPARRSRSSSSSSPAPASVTPVTAAAQGFFLEPCASENFM